MFIFKLFLIQKDLIYRPSMDMGTFSNSRKMYHEYVLLISYFNFF